MADKLETYAVFQGGAFQGQLPPPGGPGYPGAPMYGPGDFRTAFELKLTNLPLSYVLSTPIVKHS